MASENKLILGEPISNQLLDELRLEIQQLQTQYRQVPGLAVILVGNDPASQSYVGRKKKACERIGIRSAEYLLPETVSETELITLIQQLNQDPAIHGILLQVPLPKGFDEQKLLMLISPDKDVDGFHPVNVGKLLLGLKTFRSCTPYGILELLSRYNVSVEGQHVVIVGRSNIVGKPMAAMLVQKEKNANATVTICHSQSKNIQEITKQADILIVAIGKPRYITAEFVKPGAVVIDVGTNRVEDPSIERGYRLVGDVLLDDVYDKVSLITPVPRGVGPMTIAMLMKNTVQSFKQHLK